MKSTLALLFSTCMVFANQALIDLPADSWYEVPGTLMGDVMRSDMGPQVALIGAWSGGVYDPIGRQLLVWGGGLGNYRGNEFYAFSIDSLKWKRLNEPCINTGCCDPDPCGTAMVRHSYGGMAFISHANRFFVNGGARNCGSQVCPNNRTGIGVNDGNYLTKTWTFDPSAKAWELMYKADSLKPDSGDGPGSLMQTCAYDSVTRKVFYACLNGTYAYDYDANQWSQISTARSTVGQGSLVDYKRRRFVRLGADGSNWDHQVAVLDLTKPGFPKTNFMTTGANNIIPSEAVGAEYDPVADKYVCWVDSNVYSLDPDTWVWTQHSREGAPVTTPNGVYGRWRYVPHVNAYICVTAHDRNVSFYKLTAGGPASVEKSGSTPVYELTLRALPNPFNPVTRLTISGLRENGAVRISVYNITGARIHSALAGVKAGMAVHVWDAQGLPAGLYMVRAEQGRSRAHSTVLLAR